MRSGRKTNAFQRLRKQVAKQHILETNFSSREPSHWHSPHLTSQGESLLMLTTAAAATQGMITALIVVFCSMWVADLLTSLLYIHP